MGSWLKRIKNCYPSSKPNDFSNPQQEPITRSLKLPHIPVTTLTQTDLFLV